MRRFGLVGHPLSHSFSKGCFEAKFNALGIDAEYLNFDVTTVEAAVQAIKTTPGLEGVNVTIPYKTSILTFLDDVDAEAKAIGAVNTIRLERTADRFILKGSNTDVVGFRESILPLLNNTHSHALVMGTGGAAKAAIHVLTGLGIAVNTVSRQLGKADLIYNELTADIIASHTLIVNCTPAGMFPKVTERPDLPYGAIGSAHVLFDMVYNPMETAFMRAGMERGATVRNGLEMLHLQAEASWRIWSGQ